MRLSYALLAFAVVLVSGCLGQVAPFAGSGLVIEEFYPDFPAVYAGEEVQLNLLLKNKGSADARVTGIELTGLDLKSWKQKSNTCSELYRASIQVGGSASCAVALVAPDTGSLEVSFSPKVHVTYEYRSTALALVTVGTTDEVRRIAARGGSLPYEAYSSQGPISIDVKAASPVKASGTSVEFPVRITVTNSAGTACSGKCSPAAWNKITLSLETSLKASDCPAAIELTLYKGYSNQIVCNLKASASDAGAGITQKGVEVTSEYGYITQAETSLAIKKRTI